MLLQLYSLLSTMQINNFVKQQWTTLQNLVEYVLCMHMQNFLESLEEIGANLALSWKWMAHMRLSSAFDSLDGVFSEPLSIIGIGYWRANCVIQEGFKNSESM